MYMFVMSYQHMEWEIQVCWSTPVQTDLKDDLQGGFTCELAYNCTLFSGIECLYNQ